MYSKVVHKGVECNRTDGGHWSFSGPPTGAALRWGHWSRFFTPLEVKQVSPESELTVKQQAEIIRTAIDRMLADSPIHTGDIRNF